MTAQNIVNANSGGEKTKSGKRKLVFEDIVLDPVRERVTRNGREIALPPHEFKLLKYLMENPRTPVSPEAIIRRVWHSGFVPGINIVSPRVYVLRKLLTAGGERDVIHCKREEGYTLRER